MVELQGEAEAEVVVAVVRGVVVPIRHPTVPGVVVPATAPVHAVRPTFDLFTYALCIYMCQRIPLHSNRLHFIHKRYQRL